MRSIKMQVPSNGCFNRDIGAPPVPLWSYEDAPLLNSASTEVWRGGDIGIRESKFFSSFSFFYCLIYLQPLPHPACCGERNVLLFTNVPTMCHIKRFLHAGCVRLEKCLLLLNIVDLQTWGGRKDYQYMIVVINSK